MFCSRTAKRTVPEHVPIFATFSFGDGATTFDIHFQRRPCDSTCDDDGPCDLQRRRRRMDLVVAQEVHRLGPGGLRRRRKAVKAVNNYTLNA